MSARTCDKTRFAWSREITNQQIYFELKNRVEHSFSACLIMRLFTNKAYYKNSDKLKK